MQIISNKKEASNLWTLPYYLNKRLLFNIILPQHQGC